MAQSQHYNPKTYLKQWCTDGELFEYRRVGPAAKLVEQRQSPRGIGCEVDLYTLPVGGVANGLTGTGVESKLAREVDNRLPDIILAASPLRGHVVNENIARSVRWLMTTFVVRSQAALQRAEDGYPAIVEANRELLSSMRARAATAEMRRDLEQFDDPRMPAVMARALVGAAVEGAEAPTLDGDVHVLQAEDCTPLLNAAGAGEFVTFHEPVIHWDSLRLVATFALSPAALAVIVARGASLDSSECANIALHHTLEAIGHQRSLYCRTAATGELRARAATLIPWDV